VVRRLTPLRSALDPAGHHVVRERAALRPVPKADGRQEDVVVHQEGPVIHLHEQVVRAVVVAKVARDASALGHPVHPKGPAGVVDPVAPDEHVDGRVDLDSADLRAGEQATDPYVVDVVVRDLAEHAPEAPANARLLAVRYGVVPNDMPADRGLVPAVLQGAPDRPIVRIRRLGLVVPFVPVLAQRDPRTPRVADDVVLDDPALAPVRADQADLLGRGRGPRCGRVPHDEAANRDVVPPRLVRVEHRPANVDLDQLLVRIDRLELGPDRSVFLAHPAEPQTDLAGRLHDVVQLCGLAQALAVEVNRPRVVLPAPGIEPIAPNEVAVGIEVAKKGIRKNGLPHVPPDLRPVLGDL